MFLLSAKANTCEMELNNEKENKTWKKCKFTPTKRCEIVSLSLFHAD